jgi:hypothetical protein
MNLESRNKFVHRAVLVGAFWFGFHLITSSAAVTITTYVNESAWDAAVANHFVNEPFDSSGLQSFTGVTSSAGVIGPKRGVLSGSVWTDRVTVAGHESTTFVYKPGPLMAAGATWDTSPLVEGQGLSLKLTLFGSGGTANVAQIGPIDGAFFGWTSTAPFSSFTITAGSGPGIAESYDMDNLHFSSATVPEPGAFVVGTSGLIGALAVMISR